MAIYRKGNRKDQAALESAAEKIMNKKEKRSEKTPDSKKLPNSSVVFLKKDSAKPATASYIDAEGNSKPYEGPVSSLNNLQWTKIMQSAQDKRSGSQFK